jgi:hypothetical protein
LLGIFSAEIIKKLRTQNSERRTQNAECRTQKP